MKKLIIIILVLILLFVALYFIPISFLPLNRVVSYALEKRLDAHIECESMRLQLFKSLDAEGIKATGKGGIGILIKKGRFSYDLINLVTGRLKVDYTLQGITISGKASILDLITDLLSMEPIKDIKFRDISGVFFIGRNDTITQGMTGIGDYITFYVDGVTRKDGSINLRLRLLLNEKLTSSIPSEVRNFILTKEEGPWSSISIGIAGNYKKPSLRLLSESFHLDISTK